MKILNTVNAMKVFGKTSELLSVHKSILSAVSPVFKAKFSENCKINGNPIEIKNFNIKMLKLYIR